MVTDAIDPPLNVFQYYVLRLGKRPEDNTLRQLPVNSPCGLECAQVIALAVCMKSVIDPLCWDELHVVTQHAISIKWRG